MIKHRGFTLIELLIVILIISIVAGIAVITIKTNQRKQYETMANQLVNTFTLAEQEAMLRPATLGFSLTSTSFQFYYFQSEKNKWTPLNQPTLALHHIPANTQLTLHMNGEKIPADGKVRIIISSSNDLTPFAIMIGKKHENPYYQVIGHANGEVTSEIVPQE